MELILITRLKSEVSPVMGYVTGTGTLGFAFYKD